MGQADAADDVHSPLLLLPPRALPWDRLTDRQTRHRFITLAAYTVRV